MADHQLIAQLQKQIISLQGIKTPSAEMKQLGLGEIEEVFPFQIFPRAAVHEFISTSPQEAASTSAFMAIVLNKLMRQKGFCIWISPQHKIFPPALKAFGIDPSRILFIDTWKIKDALWTIEEALKCDALSAVVGEISELSFNDSRRLQLAVEKSKATGFIHRQRPRSLNAVACMSRWQIKPLASFLPGNMPGVGFPRWEVDLLKVRNGKPGKWLVQWSPNGMEYITETRTAKVYQLHTA